jgi:DNA-binding NarL/FixJ family response regulator
MSPLTLKICGFESYDVAIGRADHDMNCLAAELADEFVEQDKLCLQYGQVNTLDVNYYADGELLVDFGPKIKAVKGVENYIVCPSRIVSPRYIVEFFHSDILSAGKLVTDSKFINSMIGSYYLSNSPNLLIDYQEFDLVILFFLLRKASLKQISRFLCCEPSLIHSQLEKLQVKLKVGNLVELLDVARQRGLYQVFPSPCFSLQSSAQQVVVNPIENRLYANAGKPKLTAREVDVGRLIKDGKAVKQIAYALNLSVRTVEKHVLNIKRKFSCQTLHELVSTLYKSNYKF